MTVFLKKFDLPDPVCLYKWGWSSIRLFNATASSCHRVEAAVITAETYGTFHNNELTLAARQTMLDGNWPDSRCRYCQQIENAGGISDRQQLNSLDKPELFPIEIFKNPKAINLTPTMVEVFFNSTCNMSCIYCDRNYSTVWEQEDRKYKLIPIQELEKLETSKNNYPAMLQAHWDWLHLNHDKLALYNILGGEPFFQPELEQNIDFFIDHPSPNLTIFIFSNLKVDNSKLKRLVGKLADLKSTGKIKSCRICCSIDCWGKEAEYIRTGLQLDKWEQNLLTLLNDFPEIDLHIHTTLTSLALKTFPRLNEKINEWNKIRSISSDFSFVDCQPQLHPGIFPANFFKADFDAAAAAMGENSSLIDVLRGFENTINSLSHEPNRIDELKLFLSSLDDKRNTDWKSTFGWLNTYE